MRLVLFYLLQQLLHIFVLTTVAVFIEVLFITKVFYNLIMWFFHFYSQSESVDNTIEYSNTGSDDPVLNF